ncbi:MAG: SO_0444 family Cu/Zn efflux transporter [Rikenellaceae bacterium]
MQYLNELLSILNEMSPYLILGFLISGLLHVYVPKDLYSKFLRRRGFGSVLGAALIGVPLPLCSCGVIPTAMSLKKEGASDGATVAFLVSTPQTGVDSILATYSLLGLPFAIIRPIAAFVVAIFGGVAVDKFGRDSKPKIDYSKMKFAPAACSCGCSHDHEQDPPRKSIWAALRYGYVEMMVDFGKWLVVGLLVAAAITAFVPDSAFTLFKEHYLLNILLILLISAPMYICATGSIPIALSLIVKGVSPGAAFVLLMAGPATNLASLIILHREIGTRKTVIYLIAIILGAIACALFIDFVLPQEWFSSLLSIEDSGHHHHHHDHHHDELCTHGPIWWQTTTSVIFIVLFINSLIQKHLKRGGGHDCCSANH